MDPTQLKASKNNEIKIIKYMENELKKTLSNFSRFKSKHLKYHLDFNKLGKPFGDDPYCDYWLISKKKDELILIEIEFFGRPQLNLLKLYYYIKSNGQFNELFQPTKVNIIQFISNKIDLHDKEQCRLIKKGFFDNIDKENLKFSLTYTEKTFNLPLINDKKEQDYKNLYEFNKKNIQKIGEEISNEIIKTAKEENFEKI
jgi:hypothetical protein